MTIYIKRFKEGYTYIPTTAVSKDRKIDVRAAILVSCLLDGVAGPFQK